MACIFYLSSLISEARAKIHKRNAWKMVKKGSAVELNCTVMSGDMVHQSLAVFWYLDDVVLDWMGQTGPGKGVKVIEKRGQVLESILMIEKARLEHGGNCTCGLTRDISDNVIVHIIAGKVPPSSHIYIILADFRGLTGLNTKRILCRSANSNL